MVPSRFQLLVRTFGNYVAGLAVRGFEVVGKLALYILAAAALGAHDAGMFFLCITWVGLLSTIARLGFERAMTRHVAVELSVGRGRAAARAMRTGMSLHLATSAAAALLTWAVADFAAGGIFSEPDLAHPLALSALLLVPQTMVISVGYVLTGLKRGVAAQFVQNAMWPLLTVAALVAGARRLDELILALAGALTLATLTGAVLVARCRAQLQDAPARRDADGGESLPPLWRTALPLGLVEVVQIGLSALPVLVLGAFVDAAAVGAFSVAHRISLMMWVIIVSIGTVAAPHFAELHRRRDMGQLRALNRRVRLVTAAAGLPVILAMMAFPATLLRLIGPGFEIAAPALTLLAAGQLVNCLLPSQDLVLAMCGHGRRLQQLNIAQFVVGCILAAVLVPQFGMMGAAAVGAWILAQGAIGTTLMVRRLMPAAF
ncbi:lipopolysaccharide biosynthesis protein [Stella sp.]|uniref:lipopolysaccharide biosynthesis protein n=1 Tax=Stella sp. TaxID=2912054 RepID=UPI0035AF6E80